MAFAKKFKKLIKHGYGYEAAKFVKEFS